MSADKTTTSTEPSPAVLASFGIPAPAPVATGAPDVPAAVLRSFGLPVPSEGRS